MPRLCLASKPAMASIRYIQHAGRHAEKYVKTGLPFRLPEKNALDKSCCAADLRKRCVKADQEMLMFTR